MNLIANHVLNPFKVFDWGISKSGLAYDIISRGVHRSVPIGSALNREPTHIGSVPKFWNRN